MHGPGKEARPSCATVPGLRLLITAKRCRGLGLPGVHNYHDHARISILMVLLRPVHTSLETGPPPSGQLNAGGGGHLIDWKEEGLSPGYVHTTHSRPVVTKFEVVRLNIVIDHVLRKAREVRSLGGSGGMPPQENLEVYAFSESISDAYWG